MATQPTGCGREYLQPRWGMRNPDASAGLPDEGPLSPAEVLAILGVSRNTLIRWTTTGVLAPFRTPGGHRRYRPADIEALRVKLQQPEVPPELADDLLGISEVARRVGVHPQSVRRWADTGELPAAWQAPSGYRRYRPADVEALQVRKDGPKAASRPPEVVDDLLGQQGWPAWSEYTRKPCGGGLIPGGCRRRGKHRGATAAGAAPTSTSFWPSKPQAHRRPSEPQQILRSLTSAAIRV